MSWTSPRTWVTGELVTAALLNTHVRDNISYLNTWNQNDVTASRAIDSTVYQNTTDMIMIVTVTIKNTVGDTGDVYVIFYCDANASPTTMIGGVREHNITATNALFPFTFVVLPNYYYKAVNDGTYNDGALQDWFEWNGA